MKPFMEERLIWFTYHNEKPIAMFANIPDLNQWFKFLNGKFGMSAETEISMDGENQKK